MIFENSSPKKYTAEQIEEGIRKLPRIYLGEHYIHTDISVVTFLTYVFNNCRNTYYPVNEGFQCDGSLRRSMVDMYRLCLYYYPELSFKDFLSAFIELCGPDGKPRVIGGRWCRDVGRMVFRTKMIHGFSHEVLGVKNNINRPFINEFGYAGLPHMAKEILDREITLKLYSGYSYLY